MTDAGRVFLDESRRFLVEDYFPKIEKAVEPLTDEQIWSRANDASNSIGNLLLHLTGSSRWWATEVIHGKPIGRVRQAEFDRREPIAKERLVGDLRQAVREVDERLAAVEPATLLENPHGGDHTTLWCVYHIVEHFSMHTGQILSMSKAFTAHQVTTS